MPWWNGAVGDRAKVIVGEIIRGGHRSAAVEGDLVQDWASRSAVRFGHHEQIVVGGYMFRTCAAAERGRSTMVKCIAEGNRSLEASIVGYSRYNQLGKGLDGTRGYSLLRERGE